MIELMNGDEMRTNVLQPKPLSKAPHESWAPMRRCKLTKAIEDDLIEYLNEDVLDSR